jgi:hypothetical protein
MTKPKWLQGMVAPTLTLWLYAIALAVAWAISIDVKGPSPHADLVSRIGLQLILASWVISDAQKRGRKLCYDYGSFVFFAWPIVVPVYLFQTRGARAFLTLLCFAGIWLVAGLVGGAVALAREFLSQ